MTFPEFDKFFDEFVEECRKMRDTKGKEYANGEDRFRNFYDGAKELGVTPLQVGMIFADKHIRSIKSYIRTGKIHSEERIRGRFIDVVTYMILMAGMAEEESKDHPHAALFTIKDSVDGILPPGEDVI